MRAALSAAAPFTSAGSREPADPAQTPTNAGMPFAFTISSPRPSAPNLVHDRPAHGIPDGRSDDRAQVGYGQDHAGSGQPGFGSRETSLDFLFATGPRGPYTTLRRAAGGGRRPERVHGMTFEGPRVASSRSPARAARADPSPASTSLRVRSAASILATSSPTRLARLAAILHRPLQARASGRRAMNFLPQTIQIRGVDASSFDAIEEDCEVKVAG